MFTHRSYFTGSSFSSALPSCISSSKDLTDDGEQVLFPKWGEQQPNVIVLEVLFPVRVQQQRSHAENNGNTGGRWMKFKHFEQLPFLALSFSIKIKDDEIRLKSLYHAQTLKGVVGELNIIALLFQDLMIQI